MEHAGPVGMAELVQIRDWVMVVPECQRDQVAEAAVGLRQALVEPVVLIQQMVLIRF